MKGKINRNVSFDDSLSHKNVYLYNVTISIAQNYTTVILTMKLI